MTHSLGSLTGPDFVVPANWLCLPAKEGRCIRCCVSRGSVGGIRPEARQNAF